MEARSTMKPNIGRIREFESRAVDVASNMLRCSPAQSCSATRRSLVRRRASATAIELWLQQGHTVVTSEHIERMKRVSARIQAGLRAPCSRTAPTTSPGSGSSKFDRNAAPPLSPVTVGRVESSSSMPLGPSNEVGCRDASRSLLIVISCNLSAARSHSACITNPASLQEDLQLHPWALHPRFWFADAWSTR